MLDISGLGDLGPEELLNELDDAEEDEELHGLDLGGIERTTEEQHEEDTVETGKERMFEPDQTILDGEGWEDRSEDVGNELTGADKAELKHYEESGAYEELPPSQQVSDGERAVSMACLLSAD